MISFCSSSPAPPSRGRLVRQQPQRRHRLSPARIAPRHQVPPHPTSTISSHHRHIPQIICGFLLQLIPSPIQIISPCSDFPLIMPFIMRRVKMSGPDDPRTILQVTSQARARCGCDAVCARACMFAALRSDALAHSAAPACAWSLCGRVA